MINTTHAQRNAFAQHIANVIKKQPVHKSTGARLLAPVEDLIRMGHNNGLTNEQIYRGLKALPDHPFKTWTEEATNIQYVAAARIEWCGYRNRSKRRK